MNALQSALLDHEKQTHTLTESMQTAEELLHNQQALINTFSEKQTQSEEALNNLHDTLAEKDAILTQLSMQVMNFTMEAGKNLTAVFSSEVLAN